KRLTGTDSVLVDSTPNNVVGAWSPDCSQFIFFSDRDGRWRPYIMNSDGSNERPFLPEVFDQFTFDFTYGYNNNSLIDWTQ
ncbi:MAG: TolB family protein, partial [Ardenticatenaceae bacterium]